jgi:hypothetical protein
VCVCVCVCGGGDLVKQQSQRTCDSPKSVKFGARMLRVRRTTGRVGREQTSDGHSALFGKAVECNSDQGFKDSRMWTVWTVDSDPDPGSWQIETPSFTAELQLQLQLHHAKTTSALCSCALCRMHVQNTMSVVKCDCDWMCAVCTCYSEITS